MLRENRAGAQRQTGMRETGVAEPRPTVIASPLACLKIDVIFVILSTLLPCRPRVSRASAPGHLFLHAYKLTSTLLHTATPSSRFSLDEYPESETREIADEKGGFFLCDFYRRAPSSSSIPFFFFLFEGRFCAACCEW